MTEHWYRTVDANVDRLADRLWDVAGTLHRDPELAFEEHRAAKLLSGELAAGGFTVTRGVAGLPTAFTGEAGTGGPRVACSNTTHCPGSATPAGTT
jgi:metal-dependent amidase/aminoacylase/carboxypeptidase family protein